MQNLRVKIQKPRLQAKLKKFSVLHRNFEFKKGFATTPERPPFARAKCYAHLVCGFTLLETIVALGVILAAAVGPVSLITSGIADFTFSKNKLMAINLAQEGIELVRAVREGNIMCDVLNGAPIWPWNEDPEPPHPPSGATFTNITAGVAVDRTTTVTCGIGGVAMSVPLLSSSCTDKLRFDPATGLYGYTGPQETIFTRCVQIKVPPDSPDSGIPSGDQMDVTATIEWNERGLSKNVVLKERLYNWR